MSVTFPKKPASPTNAVVAVHPEQTLYLQSYLPEVFKGVALSMKHFFDNTKEMVMGHRPDPVLERYDEGITTISYPEQKRPYPERFRGIHRLTQRDDESRAALRASAAPPHRPSASSSSRGSTRRETSGAATSATPCGSSSTSCAHHVAAASASKPARATRSGWTPAATPRPTTRATSSSMAKTSS